MNKKIISTAFILIFAAACAPSGGDNDQNSQIQKQNEKLETEYSIVTGTYEGNLTLASGRLIPLQLGIYQVSETSDKKDSNGKIIIQPALKIRYRQLDTVRADEILNATYYSDSGTLIAAPAAAKEGQDTVSRTNINGQVLGNKISGEIIRGSGKLGHFELTLVSKDVGGQTDADRDLFDRIVKLNRSLQGTYEGTVIAPDDRPKKKFPVKVVLTSSETAKDGYIYSRLYAHYTRPDFTADPTVGERFMEVSYRLDTDPPQLNMVSKGDDESSPFYLSISGVMTGTTFEGEIKDRRGNVGHVVMTKASR